MNIQNRQINIVPDLLRKLCTVAVLVPGTPELYQMLNTPSLPTSTIPAEIHGPNMPGRMLFFWLRLMLHCDVYARTPPLHGIKTRMLRMVMELLRCAAARISCICTLPPWSVLTGQKLFVSHQAEIAQFVARRSHNPKVVSSIFTFRVAWRCLVSYGRARNGLLLTGPGTVGIPE